MSMASIQPYGTSVADHFHMARLARRSSTVPVEDHMLRKTHLMSAIRQSLHTHTCSDLPLY